MRPPKDGDRFVLPCGAHPGFWRPCVVDGRDPEGGHVVALCVPYFDAVTYVSRGPAFGNEPAVSGG